MHGRGAPDAVIRCALTLATLLLLTSCGATKSAMPDPVSNKPSKYYDSGQPFTVALRGPKQVRSGSSAAFHIELTNASRSTLSLGLAGSIYWFDVKTPDGSLVWQTSGDAAVSSIQPVTVGVGQSWSYPWQWSVQTTSGEALIEGRYIASGGVLLPSKRLAANSVEFEVID